MDRVGVAVVGAGAAGTLLAHARGGDDMVLLGHTHPAGRGVAYSTTDPGHVMNVPARRLSVSADHPDGFVRWLAERGEGHGPETYAPRATYGAYLSAALEATGVPVRAAAVTGLTRAGDGWSVALGGAPALHARRVVLATGPAPGPPPIAVPAHPRVVADPWAPGAVARLRSHRRVVVIGTGLTMVDVALSVAAAGGTVEAVSRHGALPRTHPVERCPPTRGLDPAWAPRTAGELRRGLAEAAWSEPEGWAAAVDGIRPHLDRLWGGLPEAEQARLLRRGVGEWWTYRHRMAPEVGQRLEALMEAGAVTVGRGRVASVAAADDGVEVAVEHRGRTRVLRGDAVAVCTGSLADVTRTTDPLLRSLLADGLVAPGPHRLGLRVDADGRAVDAAGRPDRSLLVLGPLRKGCLAETTAIPEIRTQAQALATLLRP